MSDTGTFTIRHSGHKPADFRALQRCKQGYSIMEVMVAATVFTVVTLGVFAALIQSYKFAKLSRCQDESRAILRTYVDQFQRLKISNDALWLFNPSNGPTGQGLTGGSLHDQYTSNGAADIPYMLLKLSTRTATVPAKLTRNVSYVNPTTGEFSPNKINGSNYLIQATFEIEFDLNGRTYKQRMTSMRSSG
jgi:Tfp pilus assembly protein PilV